MNAASVGRNSGSYLDEALRKELVKGVADRPGIEAMDAISWKNNSPTR